MSEAVDASGGVEPARWVRSDDALWRSTLDSVVLLSATRHDADPLVVDGPGVQVWALIEEATTVDEIVADLARTFSGDREVMERDVSAFLETLRAEGLAAVAP